MAIDEDVAQRLRHFLNTLGPTPSARETQLKDLHKELKLKGKPGMHHDKLEKFQNSEVPHLALTLTEWCLLNERIPGGLASLFHRSSWMERLGQEPSLLVVVGSAYMDYPELGNELVFSSDLRTVEKLLRAFRAPAPQLDLQFATLEPDKQDLQREYERHSWYNMVERSPHSAVVIGSPLTNPAAELALARILRFDPWRVPSHPEDSPFCVEFEHKNVPPSAFLARRGTAEAAGEADSTPGRRHLRFNSKWHSFDRAEGPTHGVVVLGTIGSRRVAVLIGGSAPATLACATATYGNDFPPPGKALLLHLTAAVTHDARMHAHEGRVLLPHSSKITEVIEWDCGTKTADRISGF